MPQFDFNTYSSQIFWFFICFLILFLFSHFLILPRIREILENRNNIINEDNNLSEDIMLQTENINNEAENNIKRANIEYLNQIDKIVKTNNNMRDNVIADLKNKMDIKIKKSREEIKLFIDNSSSANKKIIEDLTNNIKNKIIN